MTIIPTDIQDCYEIEPLLHRDGRGYFYEYYSQRRFDEVTGLAPKFVQDNMAFSEGPVLRGLHFQSGQHAQAKLVSVLQGEVQDVVLDLRPKSPSYGKSISVQLSAHNKKQLYVPAGCAHGYLTLTAEVLFFYKCDQFYHAESEAGIYALDPALQIEWMEDADQAEMSPKDKALPMFEEAQKIWNPKK